MEVISIDSDDEDQRTTFATTKTIITPKKRKDGDYATLTTIQRTDSNTLNTSIDLDADIYDLILGKSETELRRKYGNKSNIQSSSPRNVEDKLTEKSSKTTSNFRETSSSDDDLTENIIKQSIKAKKRERETQTLVTTKNDELMKERTKKWADLVSESSDSDHSKHSKKRKYSAMQDSDSESGYDSCSSTASTQSAKERSKIEKDFLRRAKGSYAMDEIFLTIDSHLIDTVGGKVIQEQLLLHFDQSRISIKDLPIAHSIQWYRHLPIDYVRWLQQRSGQKLSQETSELRILLSNYCLVRVPGDTLIELIQANQLIPYVEAVKAYLCKLPSSTLELYNENAKPLTLILLVEGLQTFLRSVEQARYKRIMADVNKKTKLKKSNDEIPTLPNVERALLELQLIQGVRIFETSNTTSTVQFIAQMTKNLAEAPYKKVTNILDFKSSSSSYMENGRKKLKLSEVWKKQLEEIPSVSEKIATVVAMKYPTVRSLLKAYDRYTGNGEIMLKDLQLDQKRKIGPVASKSIYDMFK
jgi:hypothetical protein